MTWRDKLEIGLKEDAPAEVAAVKAARVIKEQSELDTGCFVAYPDLRVTDDVAARTQDALGHVKGRIREAVKRGRRSAGKGKV